VCFLSSRVADKFLHYVSGSTLKTPMAYGHAQFRCGNSTDMSAERVRTRFPRMCVEHRRGKRVYWMVWL
jgi:hypothetical protein